MTKETESAIKNLSTKKNQEPVCFTGECYQTLKEKLMPAKYHSFLEWKEWFSGIASHSDRVLTEVLVRLYCTAIPWVSWFP